MSASVETDFMETDFHAQVSENNENNLINEFHTNNLRFKQLGDFLNTFLGLLNFSVVTCFKNLPPIHLSLLTVCPQIIVNRFEVSILMQK